ncbi:MAG TPA: multicopper oxidase domain-containing protein, partial [Ramlibacter sp.]|nr:multicopper oxidase domain-containing protein [Ramlibacter sp.]
TDAHERGLGLPSRYGVDDLPLVLQDKAFDRERRMVYPGGHMHAMHGVHGNAMLVNGVPRPFAQVPAGLVRLRLLNAGNARLLDVAFEDERSFHWIATEGGLLREPVALRRLSLASGQRAEVLVDFSDARPVGMVSLMAAGRSLPVMRFEPQGAPGTAAAVAPRLASWDSRPAAQTARRRRLVLGSGGMMMGGMGGMGMHTIDGRPFDMRRIDQRVRLGDTEVWEVTATGMVMPHPFHIHGVHFEVLSRGGQSPVVEDQGRRDTVIVDETVELLVHFGQPASERAPFMYHCHILEHEDMGMMGQFTVA